MFFGSQVFICFCKTPNDPSELKQFVIVTKSVPLDLNSLNEGFTQTHAYCSSHFIIVVIVILWIKWETGQISDANLKCPVLISCSKKHFMFHFLLLTVLFVIIYFRFFTLYLSFAAER